MSKRPSSSRRKTSRSAVHKKRAEEAAPLPNGIRYVMEPKGFKETARSIFDQCKKIVGADGGYIGLLSKNGREMRLLFMDAGRRTCRADTARPMPIRGLREQAIRSQKAVFCNDFPASEWQGLLPEGHVRLDNILFVPLTIQDAVVGLIGLGNKPGGFDKQDAKSITAFAELVAVTLQNSWILESLQNSEERFRTVAQSATDAIISIDQHSHVVFWNAAAESIFGWTADEMIGKPLDRIYPQRLRADHYAGMERVASTGQGRLIGKTIECVGLRRDGSEFPLGLSLSKWQTREGIFFTGIVRDITERKRAEEEYRTIVSTALDGFWVVDIQGRFLDVNDAYCHLIGYSREELLKMRIQDVEAVEKPEETAQHIQKVIEIDYDRFETLHRCKDGRVIAVEVSANYMPGDSGRFFVFLRDITERRRAEEALQKAHDELERRVQERTAELAKANEALKADITERKRTEEALRQSQQQYISLVRSIDGIMWEADAQTFQFSFVSEHAERMLGYPVERWINEPTFWKDHIHPRDREWAVSFCVSATAEMRPHQFEYRMIAADGRTVWLQDIVTVAVENNRPVRLSGVMVDITERKRAEERDHIRNHILTSITAGEPLAASLELIARLIEAEEPEAICSILLLDKEGQHLLNGAAPNLPDFYNQAIHGLKIGNGVRSCGTAAYTKQRVVVEDILTHPYWTDFRELAQKANLRSCWSEPILSTAGEVLGTFSIYHREPRSPSSEDIEAIKLAANLASLAIERKQAEEEIQRENDTRTALNTLLRLSLEDVPLDELLTQALDLILSIPWLAFESSGAIFLAEDDQALVLKGQRGLAEPIQRACARVPFGRCLCGRAAAEQKTRFANRLDVHHETTYEGIGPHGHYCVPILSAGKTLGVINVYLSEGHRRDIQEEKFLLAIADTLAGSIERKRGEEILKKLSSVVEQATDLVFITDYDGIIEYVNPAFERLTGYNKDESIGQTPRILKSGKHTPDEYKQLWEKIRAGKVLQGTVINRKKNGELFYEEKIITPLLGEQGNITHFVSTGRDVTERKRAEEQIERQVKHLNALHTIDTAIAGSLDLRLTLNIVLEQIITQLGMDAADVLLLNPHTQTLEYASGRGFRGKAIERSRCRLGEGHAGRAALERRTVHISDLSEAIQEFVRAELLSGEDFVTYTGVPLIAKGEVKGILEIYRRTPFDPSAGLSQVSEPEWLSFLEILAGQVAVAVDSAQLFTGLQRSNIELSMAYDATIEGWSRALDLRDEETEGHTQRVTELTLQLARSMDMSEAELVHIRRGCLLHDIGKMGVPDNILRKPGPLTDEEWVIMRKHPQYAFEMLSPIAYLRPALDIPYCHHEKWDGTGYPRGLKGEQIPLAARIFAVIDVYDALTSDRPYRKAWPKEKVIEHIKAGAGSHFDPQVVEAFFQVVSEVQEHKPGAG